MSSSVCSPALALKSARIASISAFSCRASSFNRLFRLTTAAGSIKRVEPARDWSCIIPGTWFLYSALTGIQYRFPRMVITASCRYVRQEPFTMELSWLWIFSLVSAMLRRICFRVGLASSAISSSERIHRRISSESVVKGVRAEK